MRESRKLARICDLLARATPRPQPRRPLPEAPRIGVLAQWGIGDAVLAEPLLRALRQRHPRASLELIGKPWLADLFAGDGVADRVWPLVPPWTAYARKDKYRLWDRSWGRYLVDLRRLREERFDLLVSARWDPRETAQLRLLRARHTFGFAGCGGAAWITEDGRLDPARHAAMHRAEVAAHAGRRLGGVVDAEPHLTVPVARRAAALSRLQAAGWRGGTLLAVHAGAGHAVRRWGDDRYAAVLATVRDRVDTVLVIDDGLAGAGIPRPGLPAILWRDDLAGLKALLSIADLLLCADNGIMHLAAAVGCRVVAIFGPQHSAWFGPVGQGQRVVSHAPMPCRPCYDRCIHATPICMERVTEHAVATALHRALDALPRFGRTGTLSRAHPIRSFVAPL